MAKGEDPRAMPASLNAVPALLAEGTERFNAGAYWDAHEAWEGAWHTLRAAGRAEEADFLQGMILAAAAFENRKRGKEQGFKRQLANALHRFRRLRGAGARLGVGNEETWREALTDLYLDACRHVKWCDWHGKTGEAPALRLAPPGDAAERVG